MNYNLFKIQLQIAIANREREKQRLAYIQSIKQGATK